MKSNNNILSFLTINDIKKLKTLHYVYIALCTLTGEFYFGKHSTDDKTKDDYSGSGVELNKRIKELGKEHFKICYIARFSSEEEAYDREEDLIRYFISDIKCLNKIISSRGSRCNHANFIYPSGKIVKLHINDPDVLSGLAVGVMKGKSNLKQKETKANKSPEEKAETIRKMKETRSKRTPEERAESLKRNSESNKKAYLNKSIEEKAEMSKKHKETIANKSPEQKAEHYKNIKEGLNNRSPEQKALESKNKSKSQKRRWQNMTQEEKDKFGGEISERKTTKFTKEEGEYILQQHYSGLSAYKMLKLFNERFRKPSDYVGRTSISNHINIFFKNH